MCPEKANFSPNGDGENHGFKFIRPMEKVGSYHSYSSCEFVWKFMNFHDYESVDPWIRMNMNLDTHEHPWIWIWNPWISMNLILNSWAVWIWLLGKYEKSWRSYKLYDYESHWERSSACGGGGIILPWPTKFKITEANS